MDDASLWHAALQDLPKIAFAFLVARLALSFHMKGWLRSLALAVLLTLAACSGVLFGGLLVVSLAVALRSGTTEVAIPIIGGMPVFVAAALFPGYWLITYLAAWLARRLLTSGRIRSVSLAVLIGSLVIGLVQVLFMVTLMCLVSSS